MITTLKIKRVIKTGITGKTAFRCNTHKTWKDRMNTRNDKYARKELQRAKSNMRCRYCHKIIGWMEFSMITSVLATSEIDARNTQTKG